MRGASPRGKMYASGSAYISGTAFAYPISAGGSGGINSKYRDPNIGSKSSSKSSSSSSSKSSSAAKSAADKEKNEFEEAYKYHQHLLKMEQEDEATYLAWLEQAYKDAYAQQKIELDDYYKYEEECFDKRKSIFEKSLKAQEHQIWLYAETMENKENAQVAVYQDMMKAVAAESRAARARGLTEEDEYIQELQKKYRDYMNKVEELRQQPYQNAISLIEKQIAYEEKGVEDSTKTRIQLTRKSIDIMNDALAAGRRRGLSETSEYMMDLKTKVREATNSIKEMIVSSFTGFTSSVGSLASAFSGVPGASQLVGQFYSMIHDANKRLLNDMLNDATGLYSIQDKMTQLSNTIGSRLSIDNHKKQLQENYDSALDALINQRMDQIKKANQKAVDEQSDALQDQIDALQDFYDKQIEMLEDEAEYEDYIKNQKEKRKNISDIEAALAQLEFDDSAAAQKRKLQLRQQLADKTAELDEFEKDHARDTAKRQLEDERDAKIDALNEQLDAVRSYTEDEYAIRKQATADIMNMDNEQFQNFIQGLIESGQITESEAKKMISNFLDTASAIGIAVEKLKAFKAMQEISGWTGIDDEMSGYMDEGKGLSNELSKTPTLEKGESQKSGKQVYDDALAAAGRAWNVAKAAKDQGAMNASHQYAEAIRQTGYAITETEALAIAGRMWYNGTAYHTPMHAIAEELRGKGYKRHYAKGTAHASSGFAMFDELGTEYYFSKDGAKYKMMSAGDKVLNAKATDFLYNFATGKNSAIQELIERMSNANIGAGVESKVVAPIINMGDINVAGDASEHTVSEIRRAQRDQMNFIIKEFNKYSR